MGSMYHHVAKGVQNRNNNNIMTWWKTNFNMPVPDIDDPDDWVIYQGPFNYYGKATSFSLSGFLPGFEIAGFFCIWHWDGPVNGYTYLYSSWRDTDGSLMFACANNIQIYLDIPVDYWTEWWYGCNQGVAGWEVDVDGDYKVRSEATGSAPIAQMETIITFSDVPSTAQLASDKAGYIWVEGNNLCFVCANRWKHTIVGSNQGYVGTSKKGYMWIDANNDLYWIGSDGNKYKTQWKIKQFASQWSNGPTGETYAGTDKKGCIWVDNEFGSTHLGYIGNDGYKYLVGAGEYPYQAP